MNNSDKNILANPLAPAAGFPIPICSILLVGLVLGMASFLFMNNGKTPGYLAYVKPDVRESCVEYSHRNRNSNFAGVLFGSEAGRMVALEDCVKAFDPGAYERYAQRVK